VCVCWTSHSQIHNVCGGAGGEVIDRSMCVVCGALRRWLWATVRQIATLTMQQWRFT